jgi:hypothetical protein
MNIRQLFLTSVLVGFGIYALAKETSDSREPASVVKKNGVICGQGPSVTAAEEKLNDKLGIGQGEALTVMTGKFGKIANPKVTGITINVVSAVGSNPANYILCAAVAGE